MFIPLIMAQRAAREFPKNVILTFLFTFVEGMYIAPFLAICRSSRAPGVVGQAGDADVRRLRRVVALRGR